MPAVQVRDLQQPYYDMLRNEAKSCGRSINKQLEVIVVKHFTEGQGNTHPKVEFIEPSFRRPAPTEEEIAARAEKRRKLFERIDSRKLPDFPEELDPATLIRQMRNER